MNIFYSCKHLNFIDEEIEVQRGLGPSFALINSDAKIWTQVYWPYVVFCKTTLLFHYGSGNTGSWCLQSCEWPFIYCNMCLPYCINVVELHVAQCLDCKVSDHKWNPNVWKLSWTLCSATHTHIPLKSAHTIRATSELGSVKECQTSIATLTQKSAVTEGPSVIPLLFFVYIWFN